MSHQSYVLEPSAVINVAIMLAAWLVVLAGYGIAVVAAVAESRRLP